MSSKKVRMLKDYPVDGVVYTCNQVIECDAKLAKMLEDGGIVDSTEEAIAFALKSTTVIMHGGAKARTPESEKPDGLAK